MLKRTHLMFAKKCIIFDECRTFDDTNIHLPSSECPAPSNVDGLCWEGPGFLSKFHARQYGCRRGAAFYQSKKIHGPFSANSVKMFTFNDYRNLSSNIQIWIPATYFQTNQFVKKRQPNIGHWYYPRLSSRVYFVRTNSRASGVVCKSVTLSTCVSSDSAEPRLSYQGPMYLWASSSPLLQSLHINHRWLGVFAAGKV